MKHFRCVILVTAIITNTAGIVIAQQCPVEWFAAEFSLIADRTVPASTREAQFDTCTNLTFFKDVLKFTPAEIESATQNAIEFFISRYGLDFSASQIDARGQRHFQNATMFPLRAPVPFIATYNRWLATGSTKSKCFLTTYYLLESKCYMEVMVVRTDCPLYVRPVLHITTTALNFVLSNHWWSNFNLPFHVVLTQ